MAYLVLVIIMIILLCVILDDRDSDLTGSTLLDLGFEYNHVQNWYRKYQGDWVITVILESDYNPSIGVRKETIDGDFDPVESFIRFESNITLKQLESVMKLYNLKIN